MPKLKRLAKIFFLAAVLAAPTKAFAQLSSLLWGQKTTTPEPVHDTVRVRRSLAPEAPELRATLLDRLPAGPRSRASAAALRESVEILCDPIFEGRRAGTDGARYASQWIRDEFEAAGLLPFEENWYHEFKVSDVTGRNVVGVLPGKSGKWIVVGAYYDGLGRIGEKVYPGADSNASGVAALIAVANTVRRDCRDGIIFVAFDARGRDFAGARHMLSEIRKSKLQVRLMVNLDVLGSTLAPVNKRKPLSLMALGGKKWSDSLRECARLTKIDLHFDYYKSESFTNLFYRKIGDQTAFLAAGIPSVVFTSGVTMNTNKAGDTPETLDYNALRARVLCISRWISMIASGGVGSPGGVGDTGHGFSAHIR